MVGGDVLADAVRLGEPADRLAWARALRDREKAGEPPELLAVAALLAIAAGVEIALLAGAPGQQAAGCPSQVGGTPQFRRQGSALRPLDWGWQRDGARPW